MSRAIGGLLLGGILASLVVALFWPHIIHLLNGKCVQLFGSKLCKYHVVSDSPKPLHPRYEGRTLRRTLGQGQMSIIGGSFRQGPFRQAIKGLSSTSAEHLASLPVSIFSMAVMALILFTLIRLFSNYLLGQGQKRHVSRYWQSDVMRSQSGRARRLSRGERVRRLIEQHGAKNVAEAVRFLAQELEEQRRLLILEA